MPSATLGLTARFDRCRRFYEDPVRIVCLQSAFLVALTLAIEEHRWLGALVGMIGQAACAAMLFAMLFQPPAAGEQAALARLELRVTLALLAGALIETLCRLLEWRAPAAAFALAVGGVGIFLGLGLTRGMRRFRLARERIFDARAAAHGSMLVAAPAVALTPDVHPWFGVVAFATAAATAVGALVVLQQAHAETVTQRVRRGGPDAPLFLREWGLLAGAAALIAVAVVRGATSAFPAALAAAPASLLIAGLPVVAILKAGRPAMQPARETTARRRAAGAPVLIQNGRGQDARSLFQERSDLGEETWRLLTEMLERALRLEAEEVSLCPVEQGVEIRSLIDGAPRVEEVLSDDDADRLAAGLHLLSADGGSFTAGPCRVRASFSGVVSLRPAYPHRPVLLLEDLGLPSDALERWKSLLRTDGLFVACGRGADTTIDASLLVRGVRIDDPSKAVTEAREHTVLLRGGAAHVDAVLRSLGAAAAPEVLRAALIQSLVRKLCISCRVAGPPDPAVVQALGLERAPDPWYSAPGCAACGGLGYRGRTGIFEFAAFRRGEAEGIVRTLFDEGLFKARQGITSCAELLHTLGPRVTAPP